MLCAVSTIPSSAAPSASGLTEDMAGLALSTNREAAPALVDFAVKRADYLADLQARPV